MEDIQQSEEHLSQRRGETAPTPHSSGSDPRLPKQPPRWVLDTNVVLDWLIFTDPHVAALATAIETEQAVLMTRADCREELVRVLRYPSVPATDAMRAAALLTYDRYATRFDGAPAGMPLPRCGDPDDQKFLELARDSGAVWLVSKDKLVLKLAGKLRRSGGYQILDPKAASRLLSPPPQPL